MQFPHAGVEYSPLLAPRARSSFEAPDMFITFLAQTPSATPAAANPLASFVPIILIFVIMYFVLFRPQMKRQKEQAKLVASVKTGDRIITASGIHGLVSNVKDRTVIVKIAENVKIEMEKSAITTVANVETAPAKTA